MNAVYGLTASTDPNRIFPHFFTKFRFILDRIGKIWYNIKDIEEIDPDRLGQLVVMFVKRILDKYGFVSAIYPDSAESVLIRGIKKALIDAELGDIPVKNARKVAINDRIFALASLSAQNRFYYTEDCKTLVEAIGTAIWNPKSLEKERLDDGTSDIDSMDAFEYTYERVINRLLPTMKLKGEEDW